MSDIDTAVVDSLTCLTPDGRLEKRTSGLLRAVGSAERISFGRQGVVLPTSLALGSLGMDGEYGTSRVFRK